VKIIKTNQNQKILIDDQDYELVSKYNWHVCKRPKRYTYYAFTHIFNDKGQRSTLQIGRLILGLKTGDKQQMDHINRNGLDNRRCNIRICSHQQNQLNRKSWGKSKYKGVTWNKRNQKWAVQIVRNKIHKFLGYFYSEKQAALAYQKESEEE
jgi:hypothetical protein